MAKELISMHVAIFEYHVWWNGDVWFRDMIYLLTAIGLTPGGSNNYTFIHKTMHRITYCNRIHRI